MILRVLATIIVVAVGRLVITGWEGLPLIIERDGSYSRVLVSLKNYRDLLRTL